jgi:tRNA nucleotidyltransferase/poly(A) polymerase
MVGSPLDELLEIAPEAWLVGGVVRDELLGRETTDYDVVLEGDPRPLARELARRGDAHAFALSEAFGAWRVTARDRSWQVDLNPLAGATLDDDLAGRDLTINAIARPLKGGDPIDPCGGLADLSARRLRMPAPSAFVRDPLRVLRLARIAAELGFEIEPDTFAAARAASGGLGSVAAERLFSELSQILACDRALSGLGVMDQTGATAVVLPELAALKGVEQSDYHHLDVYDHTLAVLEQAIELGRDPAGALDDEAGAIRRLLDEPLANELSREVALRFGALLHDSAKPQTRAVTPQGRVTFMGHDVAGATLAGEVLGRLRASERLITHVQALARHHLRLGFLVHEVPLGPRAVYGYLHACEPVEVDVTLLSVADRLATRGRGSEAAIARHLALANEMLAAGFQWRAHRPHPPIRGDRLAAALGLAPGPQLGSLLAELEEAAYAGEVRTEEQAVAHARELLARAGQRDR